MRFSRNNTPRRLRRILALDDFEAAARRFLPRSIFGYVSNGAEANWSRSDNRAAFAEYGFLPRVLKDVSERSQQITLFGQSYDAPFGIAPMGLGSLSAYRFDIVLARAAAKANIPMIVSGSSLIRMEETAAVNPAAWFQAYLPGNAERIAAVLGREFNIIPSCCCPAFGLALPVPNTHYEIVRRLHHGHPATVEPDMGKVKPACLHRLAILCVERGHKAIHRLASSCHSLGNIRVGIHRTRLSLASVMRSLA